MIGLSAVIVAASAGDPKVLTVRTDGAEEPALPSGPLEAPHRTLEAGLRSWVEAQSGLALGYVEQLYTFGDRNRGMSDGGSGRTLSIGYLALVREARPVSSLGAAWHGWYRYFPWEDWRAGRPAMLKQIERGLRDWTKKARTDEERRRRKDRASVVFGLTGMPWVEERVLERYELLYEAELVAEARRDRGETRVPAGSVVAVRAAMAADHRRILATAIARLRGKIKYRPLVFELMPASFTFLQLQQTVEGLAGLHLHKPNFRRLVQQQGLVEETGEVSPQTGGRPASLWRFRPEVAHERPAPGLKLPRPRAVG